MGLIFWWMLLIWIGFVGGFLLVWYLLRRLRHAKKVETIAVPIAHSDRLRNLPEYKQALKRYQLLLKLALGAMSVALLLSIILSARPAAISLITPAKQSRDIMLCLDVSGSVLRADSRLINRFSTLVNNFSDQRFGLTVFNSSSIAVLPLSDDYQFINERLKIIGEALRAQKGQDFTNLTSGTLADFDKGTSLVSDGVTSCINNLGENPRGRSQSVILATDNEANGTPIIKVEQVAALAEERNIRIYAIDPGESDPERVSDHDQLRELAEKTGGSYHVLSAKDTVNSIIDDISRQEADYAASIAVVAVSDIPHVFAYLLVVTVAASVALAWRLGL